MSRPKYYWYDYVKKSIRRYPDKLLEEETEQATRAYIAVKRAISDTLKLEDGEERIKIIEMLYFKGTHTIDGVAYKLNMSPATVDRRRQDFIYLVARKMGFKD